MHTNRNGGLELKFEVHWTAGEGKITCHFSCEEIVGTIVSECIQNGFPAALYPLARSTKPPPKSKAGSPSMQSDFELGGVCDEDLLAVAQASDLNQSLSGEGKNRIILDPSSDSDAESATPKGPDYFKSNPGHHGFFKGGPVPRRPDQADVPVRMPNGRWLCNHSCAGGALTKNGRQCAHRCCKEGLDKPPRRKSRKREHDDQTEESLPPSRKCPRIQYHRDSSSVRSLSLDLTEEGTPAGRTTRSEKISSYFEVIDLCDDTPSPPGSPLQAIPKVPRPSRDGLLESKSSQETLHMATEIMGPPKLGEGKANQAGPPGSPINPASYVTTQQPLSSDPGYDMGQQCGQQGPLEVEPQVRSNVSHDEGAERMNIPLSVASPQELNEPEWVSKMDAEIVNLFRGVVNFV